jgi:hypothetical protein
MASRMQGRRLGARGDMVFSARLDTTLTILDEVPAHLWTPEVRVRVMAPRDRSGER